MRFLITLLLIALSFSCHAQQVATYEIDVVSKDSFFLIERITTLPTKESPRAQTSETNQLFRSTNEFNEFLEGIKIKAKADKKAAEKQWEQATKMEEMAKKIEEAAAKVSKPVATAAKQ